MPTVNYENLIKDVERKGDKALANGETQEGMQWYLLGLRKAKEESDTESAKKFTQLLALLF